MFFIIGGDGKEYGPATVDQVRSWISAGRANLDTRAKALGTEEWRRLGDFVEFAGPAAPPPVLEAEPAAPQAGAPYAAPVGAFQVGSSGGQAELAGIGARTGAAVCNALIYFFSLMPGSMMMARRMLEANPQLANGGIPRIEDLDLTSMAEGVAWVWMGLMGAFLLQSILIAVRGQNLGKLLVGARVVRVDNGAPAGFARGVLLRFALPVSVIFLLNLAFPLGFIFLLVDYCFMFRADRRCLHDLIAGTKVVRS
jgi:uncharacterized RDD family membrane protein YckC